MNRLLPLFAAGFAAVVSTAPVASHAALIGYGVTGNGTLFSFDPDATATANNVGNLGFVPAGIDFRPAGGSTTVPVLYALQVGPVNSQLYTVNTATGAATAVGAGFASSGVGYDLTGGQTFGFDFNPRTLQPDGSLLIRLVSSGGANLRLNSDTGGIFGIDTSLATPSGAPSGLDAAAYLNTSVATTSAGGTTTLYVMNATTNSLNIQNPPNGGIVNPVGIFGVTIDANPGIGFDIYSDPAVADDTITGDRAFAVYTRSDGGSGAYLLYDVDLATGLTTGGRAVGGGQDFTGGLAIIPEPSALGLLGLAGLTALRRGGKPV